MTRDIASIRVMVVDDHPIVRDGLTATIDTQPDMQVVAQAGDGAEAVELWDHHRPDVTLMDLRLPSLSGTEAIQAIQGRDPTAPIIVLTTFDGDEDIHRAREAGARGYLLKGAPSSVIIDTIRKVRGGGRCFPPDVLSRLAERPPHSTLSDRELEVLRLIAHGASTEEVGERLAISTHTVRSHVRTVLGKLGARDRAQAISEAIRRGIVHL
jgi:two-component system, NarL family, response regulator